MPQCPTPSDWPTIVQAIGSILAIFASVGIAQWQANKAQRQALDAFDRQLRAGVLLTTKTLIEMSRSALKLQFHISGLLDSRESIYEAAEDNRLPFLMPEVYALEKALDAIELHKIPGELISLTSMVRSAFRQFRIKVDMAFDTHRQMDTSMFDDFFKTMESIKISMDRTIDDMVRILETSAVRGSPAK